VATAYADSVPMLVIAPGVPRGKVGADSGWLHEARNQQMVMSGLLSSTLRADTATAASAFIRQAFASWPVQHPRPAYLEIPLDVLEGPWDGADSGAIQPPARHSLSRAAVSEAAGSLRQGSTAILVGGGAKDVGPPLAELAERLGSPVVTTVNGKGAFPETHPLSLGASIRLPSAQEVISNADTALRAAGSDRSENCLARPARPGRGGRRRVHVFHERDGNSARAAAGIASDRRQEQRVR
jgi:thiamine pyrophosphate-dependent acetolactate synthase large subunit-like protein